MEGTLAILRTDFGKDTGIREAGLKAILIAILRIYSKPHFSEWKLISEHQIKNGSFGNMYCDLLLYNEKQRRAIVVELKYVPFQYLTYTDLSGPTQRQKIDSLANEM